MKVIKGILFAVIYTVGYVFLAMMVTGGGHGNFIAMLLIPLWIFNFVALILLTWLESKIIQIFFVIMMLLYYAIIFFMLNEAWDDKKAITHPHASGLLIPAIWFLLGQVIIWAVFFKKTRERNSLINAAL
jgi:hypothetical protein